VNLQFCRQGKEVPVSRRSNKKPKKAALEGGEGSPVALPGHEGNKDYTPPITVQARGGNHLLVAPKKKDGQKGRRARKKWCQGQECWSEKVKSRTQDGILGQ